MRAFLLLFLTLGASAQIPQPQVKVTGTLGPGGIFPLLNSGILIMADTTYTMGYPDASAAVIKLTSSVPLTATRNIIAPLGLGSTFIFFNDTNGSQVVNVCGTSGTCAAIPHDGYPHLVSTDGTNYYTAASSVGVTSISVATANGLQGSSSGGASPVLRIGPDSTHVIPINNGTIDTYLNGTGTYTIPSGIFAPAATITGGLGLTAVCSATGGCTAARGSVSFFGVATGTGIAATLTWSATPTAYNCIAVQNGIGNGAGGSPVNLFVGNGTGSTTGFSIAIWNVNTVSGFTISYTCQP